MAGLLDGKLALITGGGSGIGEGIARAMADNGARVIVADVNTEGAARVAASIGGGTAHFALDVSDRAACDALAKKVGPISILVNNAGIIRRGKLESDSARADWDATMAVNLDGPYNMVTAFLDQLKATKGSVINIGSIQSFVALPNSAAYTTSKGGVRALTKALAIELSPQGVRVNAIGPGMIATPLNAAARQNPDYMANFAQRIPLGRLGEPADIAGPAVFLASDLAGYVTGVTLPVDGGFLAY
ncbi:MAG: SDR family oxidoreductase [Rhodopila sp.]|nr:SDR family oxidoreductase [Rhodopila sp.]